MAAGTGIEPIPTESKSVVLPIRRTRYINFTMVCAISIHTSPIPAGVFPLKLHSKMKEGKKIKSCYDFVYDFHLHGIAFAI